MKDKIDLIKAAIDLSRAYNRIRNPIIGTQFKHILTVGRETDLLETIRRVENPKFDVFTLSKGELELYSTLTGVDPILLESSTLPNFLDSNLIEDKGDKVEIKFQSVSDVYTYGLSRISMGFDQKDKSILEVIAKGMKNPIEENIFDNALQKFPVFTQEIIKKYLDDAKILTPMEAKDAIYYTSPKIFKDKKVFSRVLEIAEGSQIGEILDYVSNIPGVPIDTTPENFDTKIIRGLAIAGAIEPINLDINGIVREYAFTSDITLDRTDNDHLDLVKKALSNFRFSERYAKYTLKNIEDFLSSLLDRGFAGMATPIGTDYRNLELSGIVKVEKIPRDSIGRYRLWLLKRDVIEDVLNIVRGNIALTESVPQINLSTMDNSVLSRIAIANEQESTFKEVTDAIRLIQGGLF